MSYWYWWHPVEWFCLSSPDLDVRYFSRLCTFVAYLYYNKTLLTETQPNFSSLFYAFMYSSALCRPNYKIAEQQSQFSVLLPSSCVYHIKDHSKRWTVKFFWTGLKLNDQNATCISFSFKKQMFFSTVPETLFILLHHYSSSSVHICTEEGRQTIKQLLIMFSSPTAS